MRTAVTSNETFIRFRERFHLTFWRMTHGLGAYLTVVTAYLFVLIALVVFLRQRTIYRDVAKWPSVPARAIRRMSVSRFPALASTQPGFSTSVHYVYSVDGTTHPPCQTTPDSASESHYFGETVRAYYHPEHPEIAVLHPIPYQGTKLLAALTGGALVVAGHLSLRFSGRLRRRAC